MAQCPNGEPLTNKVIPPKLKTCALRVPAAKMAQAANMSTEAFIDFYFKVCTVDYGKLVRKDGKFVLPELQGLNPENLK